MKRNQKSLEELDNELAAEIQERIENRQFTLQENFLKLNLMELGILFKK